MNVLINNIFNLIMLKEFQYKMEFQAANGKVMPARKKIKK